MLTFSQILAANAANELANFKVSELVAYANSSGGTQLKKVGTTREVAEEKAVLFANLEKIESETAPSTAGIEVTEVAVEQVVAEEKVEPATEATEVEVIEVATSGAIVVIEASPLTEAKNKLAAFFGSNEKAPETEEPGDEDDDGEECEEARERRLQAEADAEANPEAGTAKPKSSAGSWRGNNSEGVARSWCDPVVREKRLTRNGIAVKRSDQPGEGEYKSVAEAFHALGLPFNKHIKFRLELKTSDSKIAIFAHDGVSYTFELLG